MSVFELIEAVRAAGGDLRIVGDSIRVEASAPLPPALIADLRSHKVAILAALGQNEEAGRELREAAAKVAQLLRRKAGPAKS